MAVGDLEKEAGLSTACSGVVRGGASRQEQVASPRAKQGQAYGRIAVAGLCLGFLGFVPAYIRRLQGDQWFYDAVSSVNFGPAAEAAERFGTRWDRMLTLHAITAVLWTILATNQVATGTRMSVAPWLNRWHRRFGYASLFVGMCVVAEAFLLLWHMRTDLSYWAKAGTAAMIAYNLGVGISYARCKQFLLHKYAMMWACMWSAAPGHTRIFAYLKLLAFGSPVSRPVGLLTFSTLLGVALVAPTIAPAMSDRRHMKLLVLNGIAVFMMFRIDSEDLVSQ